MEEWLLRQYAWRFVASTKGWKYHNYPYPHFTLKLWGVAFIEIDLGAPTFGIWVSYVLKYPTHSVRESLHLTVPDEIMVRMRNRFVGRRKV